MKKPKGISDEHDVIRFIGRFPDKVMTKEEAKKDTSFTSKKWMCSECGFVYYFDKPVKIPSPCKRCRSIFFEKL